MKPPRCKHCGAAHWLSDPHVLPVTNLVTQVTPTVTPVGQGGVNSTPPAELPRDGISENLNFFVLLAVFFVSTGILAKLLPVIVRK